MIAEKPQVLISYRVDLNKQSGHPLLPVHAVPRRRRAVHADRLKRDRKFEFVTREDCRTPSSRRTSLV
jgi:hypothetical protein